MNDSELTAIAGAVFDKYADCATAGPRFKRDLLTGLIQILDAHSEGLDEQYRLSMESARDTAASNPQEPSG